MMRDTKQRILDVSLDLFSQRGFFAVSIRDICGKVQIKESSIYYHFKNKQSIFDELLRLFQEKATDMMGQLETSLEKQTCYEKEDFYQNVCDTFFEGYFMDRFCNKVMRLLLIEQFSNEGMQQVYEHWMFAAPLSFQSKVFSVLMKAGVVQNTDHEYMAVKYYAPIYFFAQRWLFKGNYPKHEKTPFVQTPIAIFKNFLLR